MDRYDLIVIGTGPAGYVAAIRAAQLGLKVAAVEKENLGGVCLNIGCIPSKSLLKNAELAHTLRNHAADFGISFDNLELDYPAAVNRSRQVSQRLTSGVEFLFKKNKIDLYRGRAELTARDRIQVVGEEETQELAAENIIIATGARPFVIPGVEVDGERVYTYERAILQESLPESVLIVGAGAIGMEFATIWNSYGVPVTVVEMEERLLPREDPEVSREMQRAFKKRRIETRTSARVTAVEIEEDQVSVTLDTPRGEEQLAVDQVLLATSFVPNSEGIGLEEVGVALSERGFIDIDERMATSVTGIWAVGDVTGKLMLAHVGMEMGVICAEHIAGKESRSLDYRMMPRGTFCSPQVASFGYSEEEARQAGYEVQTGKFLFRANGKALGIRESDGWVKIVVDQKFGEILGAHLVGPEVTELLGELSLARRMELTPTEIGHTVHTHPTLSEVIVEAALAVTGRQIHA